MIYLYIIGICAAAAPFGAAMYLTLLAGAFIRKWIYHE